jgi:quercetin dioxygenase-like cupin family protein
MAAAVKLNGFPCKANITADDFFFAGLKNAGNTNNAAGSVVTAANVMSFPGVNTLGVSMARIDYAPGGQHPPHTHPNEELVIIREGQVETLSGGVWKKVGPGGVIFNASNSPHALRNIGTTNAVYHVINWKGAKAG